MSVVQSFAFYACLPCTPTMFITFDLIFVASRAYRYIFRWYKIRSEDANSPSPRIKQSNIMHVSCSRLAPYPLFTSFIGGMTPIIGVLSKNTFREVSDLHDLGDTTHRLPERRILPLVICTPIACTFPTQAARVYPFAPTPVAELMPTPAKERVDHST